MRNKNGPEPEFVPAADSVGRQPRGFMKWNENSLEWEYWLNGEKVLIFSDFGLQMTIKQHKQGEVTGRVEVVVQQFHDALVLRSVPLTGLRAFIKDTYGVDI